MALQLSYGFKGSLSNAISTLAIGVDLRPLETIDFIFNATQVLCITNRNLDMALCQHFLS